MSEENVCYNSAIHQGIHFDAIFKKIKTANIQILFIYSNNQNKLVISELQ